MRWGWIWAAVLAFVLVPYILFDASLSALASRLLQGGLGSGTVFAAIVGLLASDVILPIPSSIVAAAAGVLLKLWGGTAAVWLGMTLGCVIGYWIGARSSRVARRFVGEDDLARAQRLAATHGTWALVACRPIPVLAEATVIVAGIVGTPFRRFLMLTACANFGIALGYAAIGAFSMRIDSFLLAFLGAITIPGAAMAVSRLAFRQR
jgi:membrane protein DedA with SNARE-associated domain